MWKETIKEKNLYSTRVGTIFEIKFYFDCYWSESDFENKYINVTTIAIVSVRVSSFV
jgi:hypothetical protein